MSQETKSKTEKELIKTLKEAEEPLRVNEIREKTGLETPEVSRSLRRLLYSGKVDRAAEFGIPTYCLKQEEKESD